MAGDWIKMRTDLIDDPAVIFIGRGLDIGEDLVVAKLYRLWSWADKHTTDGNAVGVTDSWVDRYLGVPNFAKLMSQAGWLQVTENGIVFPKFERHNGKSAKRRALTSKRVADHKAKKGNAKVTLSALPREEKSTVVVGSSTEGNSFKTLENVQREHLTDVSSLCRIHRALHSENPEMFPAEMASLGQIAGAASVALVKGRNPVEYFCGIIRKGQWKWPNGDLKKKIVNQLKGHVSWIESERAAGREPDEMITPLTNHTTPSQNGAS